MPGRLLAAPRRLARTVVPASIHARLFHLVEDTRLFRRLHGETNFIEATLHGLTPGRPWDGFADPARSAGFSERVVEMPWALSRYDGDRRVLDIGACFALGVWTRHIASLGVPELHGVDVATRPVRGMAVTQADVRDMPFDHGYFDLAYFVSTMEHVGEDNAHYSVREERGAGDVRPDTAALTEIARVLRPGGRVIVSVPFGKAEEMGWQRVYDLDVWSQAVAGTGLETVEQAIHALDAGGWRPSPAERPPTTAYREAGAPAATAVLCSVLRRPA